MHGNLNFYKTDFIHCWLQTIKRWCQPCIYLDSCFFFYKNWPIKCPAASKNKMSDWSQEFYLPDIQSRGFWSCFCDYFYNWTESCALILYQLATFYYVEQKNIENLFCLFQCLQVKYFNLHGFQWIYQYQIHLYSHQVVVTW